MTSTMRRHSAYFWRVALAVVGVLAFTGSATATATTTPGSLTFTNTPLTTVQGNSEPEISSAAGGGLAIVGLGWNFPFGTNLWTGQFGSAPTAQGSIDTALHQQAKQEFGGGDADVVLGATHTLHATTLVIFVNSTFKRATLGVSSINCPNGDSPKFDPSACSGQILDTAGVDRPWITSDGSHVWIAYHDSGRSSIIHVQRSDDDGMTWARVGDPIVGQGGTTGDSTFNNIAGPIKADPSTHAVYEIFAAGETGVLKGRTFTPDRVIVSKSTDGGMTWSASQVFHMPTAPNTGFGNIFPSLAVDPTNGKVFATWSDSHTIWLSSSADGVSWSTPAAVSASPVSSALMPWVAAYNGTVDVVYYGTSAASNLDASANWFVYLAQTTNAADFTQSQVNTKTNHVGVICTHGTGCAQGTRNLLDLFQVAIDPQNLKAAIIYTDDTLATTPAPNFSCLPSQTTTCPLPEVVLAQQN